MKIVIIGGIAAGMSAAAKAKRSNQAAEVTIIEMENYVSFGACGLPYYLGGRFDDPKELFARTPEQMQEQGIRLLMNHRATHIDFDQKEIIVRNCQTQEQIIEPYDRLMIATGATPLIPEIPNIHAENMYTITRLDQTKQLKERLDHYQTIAILGAGFIGIEVASELARLGKKVHLFDMSEAVLSRVFDSELSDDIKLALEKQNISVHLSQNIEKFEQKNDQIHSITSNAQSYSIDALIVAAGFIPNTQWIQDSRLKRLSNGAIIIDVHGQTSIKDVFSGGDCASVPHQFLGDIYLPLATSANKLGRVVGTNLNLEPDQWVTYEKSLGSSAIKVGQYEFGSTGLTEQQAIQLNIDCSTTCIQANNHSNYWPNQTKIKIKLVYETKTKRLLGAQVGGESGAVLRLTGFSTAIFAGLTTKQLGGLDYSYAPPFSSVWEAINLAANTAK